MKPLLMGQEWMGPRPQQETVPLACAPLTQTDAVAAMPQMARCCSREVCCHRWCLLRQWKWHGRHMMEQDWRGYTSPQKINPCLFASKYWLMQQRLRLLLDQGPGLSQWK